MTTQPPGYPVTNNTHSIRHVTEQSASTTSFLTTTTLTKYDHSDVTVEERAAAQAEEELRPLHHRLADYLRRPADLSG